MSCRWKSVHRVPCYDLSVAYTLSPHSTCIYFFKHQHASSKYNGLHCMSVPSSRSQNRLQVTPMRVRAFLLGPPNSTSHSKKLLFFPPKVTIATDTCLFPVCSCLASKKGRRGTTCFWPCSVFRTRGDDRMSVLLWCCLQNAKKSNPEW